MTDIRFYHLVRKGVLDALPILLTKAMASGKRIVIRCAPDFDIKALSAHLWTWSADSFLPHDYEGKNAAKQPIWITNSCDNPNGAQILFLLSGASEEEVDDYDLICRIFCDNDIDALQSARAAWKSLKDANYSPTYWKENQDGGWEKK